MARPGHKTHVFAGSIKRAKFLRLRVQEASGFRCRINEEASERFFQQDRAKVVAMLGDDRQFSESRNRKDWQGFIALLMEAAFEMGYRELNVYYDDGPLKMEFVTQQNNAFYVLVLEDDFKNAYARVLGPIKSLESEEEAIYLLMQNKVPGVKVYLENEFFKDETCMAVLSQETIIDGFPLSKLTLRKSLEKLDGNLSSIKQEFVFSRQDMACTLLDQLNSMTW